MKVVLLAALAVGCVATEPGRDEAQFRRSACADIEGLTWLSPLGQRVAFSSDDAEYSAYESRSSSGLLSTGLVQCEAVPSYPSLTLIYADAADPHNARIDEGTSTGRILFWVDGTWLQLSE